MQRRIDFNCDMGESFGAWRMGDDAGVMPFITSANIACGFHAGDSETMRATVALAVEHAVAIGAHVGLPDLEGFGRRVMYIDARQAYAYTLHQLGALSAFAKVAGASLHHVKPHGALYHMVARDAPLALAMVGAIRDFDARLRVYGPAVSELATASSGAGLHFVAEGFADRRYASNGRLLPRTDAAALIEGIDDAVAQALVLIERGLPGDPSGMRMETLCLHGDRGDAATFARGLRQALEAAGVKVTAPGRAMS